MALRRRDDRFVNWAGNQRCTPLGTARPASTDEVRAVVRDAAEHVGRVKVVGAGHSFTAAACTSGVLVDVSAMSGVESLDPETGVAVVGAGTTLADLNRALDERGRALPNLGDIDRQSLAGATATATHGTGIGFGNLSTGIRGFELVTGTGEIHWCDAEADVELFSAGRVGIGALGIVTRIAIDTVPAFNLHSVETAEPLSEVLDDWDGFVESAEHVEFFWLPGSRRCLIKRNNRTAGRASWLASHRTQVEKIVVENLAFGAAMRAIRRFPAARPRISKVLGRVSVSSERVDRSHRIFATPRHVRFLEMEYGLPVDAVPEAVGRVRRLVDTLADPPAFPIEVRVSAADDIPLSTGEGRTSGWVAVHRYVGLPHEEYFRGVEAIMDDYDGRPHWGKLHHQSAETLAPRYPRWREFAQVRRRVDPAGLFRNDYLDRVLGPIG